MKCTLRRHLTNKLKNVDPWYDHHLHFVVLFSLKNMEVQGQGGTSWLRDAGLLDTILMSEDQ